MSVSMKAVEMEGVVGADHRLMVCEPVPDIAPGRVRVLILAPEYGEPSEGDWLSAAAAIPAFDFLRDPAEDVYSASDGRPFVDEG